MVVGKKIVVKTDENISKTFNVHSRIDLVPERNDLVETIHS